MKCYTPSINAPIRKCVSFGIYDMPLRIASSIKRRHFAIMAEVEGDIFIYMSAAISIHFAASEYHLNIT